MIYDTVIVGSGFSAYCAASFLGKNTAFKVISPNFTNFPIEYKRIKSLEFNRLFSARHNSMSNLSWDIGANRLVDRLGIGGNTTIWGATVNLDACTQNFDKLRGFRIRPMRDVMGLKSNKNLGVMVDEDKRLFSTYKFFADNQNHVSGFVSDFKIDNSLFRVRYFDSSSFKDISCKKIFLCLSVPQTIALLINSKLIYGGAVFSLSEHKMDFKLHNPRFQFGNACVVSYKTHLAIARALGIRAVDKDIFNKGPYLIDQIFTSSVNEMKFLYNPKNVSDIQTLDLKSRFGSSIHYFGLYVNGVQLTNYLNTISKNIFVFGHSSIQPDLPGPLTNDILNDVASKIF